MTRRQRKRRDVMDARRFAVSLARWRRLGCDLRRRERVQARLEREITAAFFFHAARVMHGVC